jgi:hypothetical protein
MPFVRAIDQFFHRVKSIPYSPLLLILVPIIIGTVRIAEEMVFQGLMMDATDETIFNVILGYIMLVFLMTSVLCISTGKAWREMAGAASLGLVFGLLPPLLDYFGFSLKPGQRYMYFAEFSWNFVASYQPTGETVTIWLVIASTTIFVSWLTRSVWRSLTAFVFSYLSLQFYFWGLNAFCAAFLQNIGFHFFEVSNLLFLVIALALYIVFNLKTMLPSLLRFNHSLPFGLITAIGSRMAGEPWPVSVIKGFMFFLAFQLAIFANDYFDQAQDAAEGGKARPITRDDAIMIGAFHLLLIWFGFVFFNASAFLLLAFLTLWTVYHLPSLRFKRLFCLGYKIEGVSAAVAFLFGTIGASRTINIPHAPAYFLLVMGGFSVCSMFKDYKDIDQDMAAKVGTIYTRQLKKGRSLRAIHAFVVSSLWVALMIPPMWFWLSKRLHFIAATLGLLACITTMLFPVLKNRKIAVEAVVYLISVYFLIIYFYII